MNIVKKMVSVILSFCLMGLVIGICLVSALPAFLSSSMYTRVMEKANIYQSVQETIQNGLDDIMLFNNIDRQTMHEFISVEEVKQTIVGDTKQLIGWLNGSNQVLAPLQLADYESRFDERMGDFFRNNQYYLDDQAKADVELMKQDAMQVIKGSLRVLDFDKLMEIPVVTKVPQLVGLLNVKLIVTVLVVLSVLIIGVMIWLSPASRKKHHRKKVEVGLLYAAYGLVAGGLLVFIIFFSGIQSGFYEHTAIHVDYLRESVGYLIKDRLQFLSLAGFVFASIGFMLMIPYWRRLYRKCMA
ncbi:hypothetical protein T23_16980 [Turicibacter faecis]|uniref:Uncharacterized protein n=1 Tax=Turicibacter faecis TaxID=2963365 RepID=A0ABN6ZDC3_9FIRM|nr:hypothetical protein T23_16980 [Turicibacter sp. TC023]